MSELGRCLRLAYAVVPPELCCTKLARIHGKFKASRMGRQDLTDEIGEGDWHPLHEALIEGGWLQM